MEQQLTQLLAQASQRTLILWLVFVAIVLVLVISVWHSLRVIEHYQRYSRHNQGGQQTIHCTQQIGDGLQVRVTIELQPVANQRGLHIEPHQGQIPTDDQQRQPEASQKNIDAT